MKKLFLALIVLGFMTMAAYSDSGNETTFYYNEKGEPDGYSIKQPNASFYYDKEGKPNGFELRTPQPQEFKPVNPDMYYGKDYYKKHRLWR